MKEVWREIQGFPDYRISNTGKVYSVRRNIIMKTHCNRGGYEYVMIRNGNKKTITIHRLVALNFLPNPDKKPHINHKDCIKTNNHSSNLEWCTNLENRRHAWQNNLMNPRMGESHRNSKVTWEDVIYIRSHPEFMLKELAAKFGISETTVCAIKRYRVWREKTWEHPSIKETERQGLS